MKIEIEGTLPGVRYDVTGDELRKHCEERAKYHEGRKKFYEEKEKEFGGQADELAEADEAVKYSNNLTQSNADRMRASKNHHADRVKFFKFAAAHLKQDEYHLSYGEIASFEMIPRGQGGF